MDKRQFRADKLTKWVILTVAILALFLAVASTLGINHQSPKYITPIPTIIASPSASICQNLTLDQATENVNKLKEVQDYLLENKDLAAYISNGPDLDSEFYYLQLSRLWPPEKPDHRSVSEWYRVDKCHGKIEKIDYPGGSVI